MRTEIFSLPLATSTQVFDTLVRVIRYDEGSGTGTPKIRIKSLSGGAFDVEMVPGRQIKLPEVVRGLHISNLTAAAITGKITIGSGDISDNSLVGTVTLDAATLAALESVDLNAATLAALESVDLNTATQLGIKTPVSITGSYGKITPPTGSAEQIFSAAENTNGAILLSADAHYFDTATAGVASFLAKSSAPASVIDGQLILTMGTQGNASGGFQGRACLPCPQFIAAGLGLFFMQAGTGSNHTCIRSARYRLL